MTNKEKFKEVFGLEIDDNTSVCGFFDCTDRVCKDCPVKDTEDWWNAEYKEPTTKNDIPHCQHTDDEEIAQSFKEDVEAVKDLLPCGEQMDFPSTFDEFANVYGFKDKEEVYTNGSELIPVFRVKQWLEHISTTKNDLGVDAVSRQAVLDLIADYDLSMGQVVRGIHALPPVTPQEPRCKECKWWEESDGKHRRGCKTESRCPINTYAVYCGEGYCYRFSPKGYGEVEK